MIRLVSLFLAGFFIAGVGSAQNYDSLIRLHDLGKQYKDISQSKEYLPMPLKDLTIKVVGGIKNASVYSGERIKSKNISREETSRLQRDLGEYTAKFLNYYAKCQIQNTSRWQLLIDLKPVSGAITSRQYSVDQISDEDQGIYAGANQEVDQRVYADFYLMDTKSNTMVFGGTSSGFGSIADSAISDLAKNIAVSVTNLIRVHQGV